MLDNANGLTAKGHQSKNEAVAILMGKKVAKQWPKSGQAVDILLEKSSSDLSCPVKSVRPSNISCCFC